MSVERLVQMANDIGHFFAAEPQARGRGRRHCQPHQRFWDPRMRRQILAHLQAGGAGLEDLPREAVASLKPS